MGCFAFINYNVLTAGGIRNYNFCSVMRLHNFILFIFFVNSVMLVPVNKWYYENDDEVVL